MARKTCNSLQGEDGAEEVGDRGRFLPPTVARADQLGASVGSPRLITGSPYLQYFDLSDEDVVRQWLKGLYWQVVTGETYLQTEPPIEPSSLTRWRKRLGEACVEELLAETIEADDCRYNCDGEAIAHPTDARPLERCRAAPTTGMRLPKRWNRRRF